MISRPIAFPTGIKRREISRYDCPVTAAINPDPSSLRNSRHTGAQVSPDAAARSRGRITGRSATKSCRNIARRVFDPNILSSMFKGFLCFCHAHRRVPVCRHRAQAQNPHRRKATSAKRGGVASLRGCGHSGVCNKVRRLSFDYVKNFRINRRWVFRIQVVC